MLWETSDPNAALQERFGLADLEGATAWVSATLRERWHLHVTGVERVLISAANALVWARTEHATFVVKMCADTASFARLANIATLVGDLAADLPVAAPIPGTDGRRRQLAHTSRPLSVAVHPLIDGDILDVSDLASVRAAGEMVGRLHLALATIDPTPFANGPRESNGDLAGSIGTGLGRLPIERAPRAHARLRELLSTLPALDTAPQLAHGDIRGANILTRDGQVAALLDFDEVSIRHRTVEIALGAVLLGTQFRTWAPAPAGAQRTFLEGYDDVVALTDTERAWTEALRLWFGITQIPPGPDPHGWADAVEQGW